MAVSQQPRASFSSGRSIPAAKLGLKGFLANTPLLRRLHTRLSLVCEKRYHYHQPTELSRLEVYKGPLHTWILRNLLGRATHTSVVLL